MTQFWWVRHGPTHKKTMIGWTDVPADLSNTDQIARLNDHLPKDALVISSDLIRCINTADALSIGRERLSHNAGIRELHFGDWEDTHFNDIPPDQQKYLRTFWENPGDHSTPNGESWNQLSNRVSKEVTNLVQTHKGRDVIVVAHYGVILTQIQIAGGMTAQAATSFQIDNLSVTKLDHLGDDTWRIAGVNHKP